MKLKFTGEIEIDPKDLAEFLQSLQSKPEAPTPQPPVIEIPQSKPDNAPVPDDTIILSSEEWSRIVSAGYYLIPDGATVLIPNYKTEFPIKDGLVECHGKARIIWGKENYNQWRGDGSEAQVILNLGQWNHTFTFRNVDPLSAKLIDEVQPFYRTLFQNTPAKDQKGRVELINAETNMEFTFLYSGSQDEDITTYAKKVRFRGPIWQELKANNGGGIVSIVEDCHLTATDPITHFRAELAFSQGLVRSSVCFDLIENEFIENGNSCNILYLPTENATFYLPKGLEADPFTHRIRTIPMVGESHQITWTGFYLRSIHIELQVGDIFLFDGVEYRIDSKDRASQSHFDHRTVGYYIEYGLNKPIPSGEQEIEIKLIKSRGQELFAKPAISGYMIFKYNKRFHTNILPLPNLTLDYYLDSDPFGVLFYFHKEASIRLENTEYSGFIRQSRSGVGKSKGYSFINTKPFGDQFNPDPDVQVITS